MTIHHRHHNSLTKGPDTLTKAEVLRRAASSIKQNDVELRKTRIANAIEHVNDPIDTPFEVEAFTAGRIGPIDTQLEMQRYLKSELRSGKNKKDIHEDTEALNYLTPRPRPS